jgi:hypothetical protein
MADDTTPAKPCSFGHTDRPAPLTTREYTEQKPALVDSFPSDQRVITIQGTTLKFQSLPKEQQKRILSKGLSSPSPIHRRKETGVSKVELNRS